MNLRKTLSGAALATTLLLGAALPAYAVNIPLGGYSGPLQLNFNNYESFFTPGGTVDPLGPQVGDQNAGVFSVQSITVPGLGGQTLWTSGQNGDVLVGVFNGIMVTSVSGPPSAETTTNTGGVFDLYLVPTSQFLAAGGDQGLAGYGNAGCALATLCYNGITNTGGGALALTMTLTPGIDGPGVTLTAQVNATLNPPTGSAAFDGTLSNTMQFKPNVSGKDSFCPNNSPLCSGADGSTFSLASQDPIIATAVPEPASLLLFGGGLLGLGSLSRWRRRRKGGRVAV